MSTPNVNIRSLGKKRRRIFGIKIYAVIQDTAIAEKRHKTMSTKLDNKTQKNGIGTRLIAARFICHIIHMNHHSKWSLSSEME